MPCIHTCIILTQRIYILKDKCLVNFLKYNNCNSGYFLIFIVLVKADYTLQLVSTSIYMNYCVYKGVNISCFPDKRKSKQTWWILWENILYLFSEARTCCLVKMFSVYDLKREKINNLASFFFFVYVPIPESTRFKALAYLISMKI